MHVCVNNVHTGHTYLNKFSSLVSEGTLNASNKKKIYCIGIKQNQKKKTSKLQKLT